MMKGASELKAGVIGLGQIGGGVAVSLMNKGRVPACYDVVDVADRWPTLPRQLTSPLEVARASDIIMVAVFTAEQVRSVLNGPEGLLAGAHEGMVVVVLSTIGVDETREFYELCKARGAGFLDCGVTPGMLADQNGLTAFTGGDTDVFEYAKPILDDWAGDVVYCGPSGSGMITKIARNVITYGTWRVITEAQRLAEAYGVKADVLLGALQTADKTQTLHYQMLLMKQDTGILDPGLGEMLRTYMEKDLAAAKQAADKAGVAMPVRDAVCGLIDNTCDLK